MNRVLVVTPNWPPISCPDLHRVRMALPFFDRFGWEPLILKVDPTQQEGIRDPDLCVSIPESIKVWQAGAIPRRWTTWFGLNNVGIRSMLHLARLGSRIIEEERPSLVFFSTTMFPLMILGRYWQLRYKVPYVLDFQDPWRVEPGTKIAARQRSFKRFLTRLLAAVLEPIAVGGSSHVVSVSPQYPKTLLQRYPRFPSDRFTVLPFGAAEWDFKLLADLQIGQTIFARSDGKSHWVYVGRGGADMTFAARALFQALNNARNASPEKYDDVMLHFIGTDYAPAESSRKTIEPIAVECGVADLVEEISTRIPYFEALQCLMDADALIVLGSDDRGYTASKIYPYILADKPLLAIFHRNSSVVEVIRSTNAGTVVTFDKSISVDALATEIVERWFNCGISRTRTNWHMFEPYTAQGMTRTLCTLFDAVVNGGGDD